MITLPRAFNMILALLFCGLAGFGPVGCKSADKKKNDKAKQGSFLRFHLETNPDPAGTRTIQAQVYRGQPILLTVIRDPVLDEGYLEKAEVVDADEHGGIALKLTFDPAGTRRLDSLTVENRGLHFAISGVWTDTRWLAAPLITKRISNGVFVFTPDATREEAERIVAGLQNVIKKLQKKYTF